MVEATWGQWTRYPSLRVRRGDEHRAGQVFVLLEATVPHDQDETMHDNVIGAYGTWRQAWRGFVEYVISIDGRPLDTLHRLTWSEYPGTWEAWDDEQWGEPGALRFALTRADVTPA